MESLGTAGPDRGGDRRSRRRPLSLFVRPYFRDGELKLLLANTGHWTDVGSMTPGGFTTTATDIAATTCLIVSVLLAFWLMHLLSMVALGKSNKKGRGKAALVLGTVVLLMCGVVQRIKHYGEPVVAVEAESPDEHGGE